MEFGWSFTVGSSKDSLFYWSVDVQYSRSTYNNLMCNIYLFRKKERTRVHVFDWRREHWSLVTVAIYSGSFLIFPQLLWSIRASTKSTCRGLTRQGNVGWSRWKTWIVVEIMCGFVLHKSDLNWGSEFVTVYGLS